MVIRKAKKNDIEAISNLLYVVHDLHASNRSDIFKKGKSKYSNEELATIIENKQTPIYVAEEKNQVVGYIFCIYQEISNHQSLEDQKTLYIDDLCVDENYRGKHIGTSLYNHAKIMAKANGCTQITLNVWSFNTSAFEFYKKLGLSPLKVYMEEKL